MADDNKVNFRFCNQFNAWCCQSEHSTADCCTQNAGVIWNNATIINFAVADQETSYVFDLADAYTTTTATESTTTSVTSGSITTTTQNQNSGSSATSTALKSGTSTSSSSSTPSNTQTCSTAPSTALGLGLGIGLGLPLLAALAALLWMIASKRHHQPVNTSEQSHLPMKMQPPPSTGGLHELGQAYCRYDIGYHGNELHAVSKPAGLQQ